MRGGRNVEQKWFPIGQRDQDRDLRQKLLNRVNLLQKPIEGETSFAEARDESAECGEAPNDLLNPLYVLNWAHPSDG